MGERWPFTVSRPNAVRAAGQNPPADVWAFDCSDYTTGLTTVTAASLLARGFRRCIAELNLPGVGGTPTASLLQAAANAGLDTQAYVYANPAQPAEALATIAMVANGEYSGVQLSRLWLDVEILYGVGSVPAASEIESGLDALLSAADAAMARGNVAAPPTGIYTDASWFPDYLPGVTKYSGRPLWLAAPGPPPALPLVCDINGWAAPAGIQYGEDQSVAGVGPIDLSVFAS